MSKRPKAAPVTIRVSPPSRRQNLQVSLMREIPHYATATLEQVHHAIEIVERYVSIESMPNILDSDDRVIGFLSARAVDKYGDPVPSEAMKRAAFSMGYNLYKEVCL